MTIVCIPFDIGIFISMLILGSIFGAIACIIEYGRIIGGINPFERWL